MLFFLLRLLPHKSLSGKSCDFTVFNLSLSTEEKDTNNIITLPGNH